MTAARRVRCAIVGCGTIAHEYVRTLSRSQTVDIVACADIDPGVASGFAEQHCIPHAMAFNDLLAGRRIDLGVILTPPATHADLAVQAIEAGVSVYVEKPLALDLGDGLRIIDATDRHGVVVGAAPDTFLAPPTQTAARAIADGLIGQPIAASAALLSPGPERWHPAPRSCYAAGVGPLYDMGPYYLTTLVQLLSPVIRVDGATTTCRSKRTIRTGPRAGQTFISSVHTHVAALLRTASDVPVTLTTSFDIPATTKPHLEIYGSDATLVFPDPNFHEGAVRIRRGDDDEWRTLPQPDSDLSPVGRGIGVIDTARAILSGQPHRATGRLALHILHIMKAIEQAAQLRHAVDVLDQGSAEDIT